MILSTQHYNFPQWPVKVANCMFVGVNDTYIDFLDNHLLYAIDTKIHHVESWGSFAKNAEAAVKCWFSLRMRLIIVKRQFNGERMHH
jgi:hypothetical protein